MKIQLDTDLKTIKIQDNINLGKFLETIKKLLPDNTWKEYKLEANTVFYNWNNPIYIQPYTNVYPYRTYYSTGNNLGQTDITTNLASANITLTKSATTISKGDYSPILESKNILNFEITD